MKSLLDRYARQRAESYRALTHRRRAEVIEEALWLGGLALTVALWVLAG